MIIKGLGLQAMALNLHLATILKEYLSEPGEAPAVSDKPGSSAFIQWPALELGGNNKKAVCYNLTARLITYSADSSGNIPDLVHKHRRTSNGDEFLKSIASSTRNMLLYKGADVSDATIADLLKALQNVTISGLKFEISYFVQDDPSSKRIGVFYNCMGHDGPMTTVIAWLAIDLKESF